MLRHTRGTATLSRRLGLQVLGERCCVNVRRVLERDQQLAHDGRDAAGAVALHVKRQHRVMQRQAQQEPAIAVLGVACDAHALCGSGDEESLWRAALVLAAPRSPSRYDGASGRTKVVGYQRPAGGVLDRAGQVVNGALAGRRKLGSGDLETELFVLHGLAQPTDGEAQ